MAFNKIITSGFKNYYISKSGGNNAETGLDPTLPVADIQRAVDYALIALSANNQVFNFIVGSGHYDESVSIPYTTSYEGAIFNFFGDGYVKMKTNTIDKAFNLTSSTIARTTPPKFNCEYFIFEDFPTNIFYMTADSYWWDKFNSTFKNCIFINGDILSGHSERGTIHGLKLIDCIYISGIIRNTNVFKNSTFGAGIIFKEIVTVPDYVGPVNIEEISSCNIGAGCSLDFRTATNQAGTLTIKNWHHNNNRATIPTAGGTVVFGSIINSNNINSDPLFNNSDLNDFTLTAASPNVGAGTGGTDIGARGVYNDYNGTDAGSPIKLANGATHVNITETATGFILTNPTILGTIESADIDFGAIKQISATEGFFAQEYPANVIDTEKTDTKPNRLQYELKYALSQAGLATATYKLFEFGTTPKVDVNGRGNGDNLFDQAQSGYPVIQWIKIKITLRPDGV